VPAVLGPALLADQRHEHDAAEVLLLVLRLACSRHREQGLVPFFRSNRDDQSTADGKLLFQRLRHFGPASGHQDGVERRGIGPAERAITHPQLDVVVAQPPEPLLSRLAQRRVAFDGIDPVGNPAHDGGGIA
jgi:hypothetical protein